MDLYNTYGIYGIRNKINGKMYIGKTQVNFGDRRDCHFASLRGGYGVNSHLQKAWNKYGESNFDFIVLRDCTNWGNTNSINILEQEYIKHYADAKMAYNIGVGGDGGNLLGTHLSEETKRKIGEKNKINMTGRKASDETKRKMSDSQKKRYKDWTEADRKAWGEKSSKCASGYKLGDNFRRKMSEIQKTKPHGAKYDINTVHEIRRLFEEEGKTFSEISELLNIRRCTVYLIATYRRWKYV